MNSQIGDSSTDSEIYRIRIQNEDAHFRASGAVSLLVAMEQAREDIISVGCRGGGCGKCRIRVLDGDYRSKRMSRAWISEEDEAEGVVLACRIFARSDLTIMPDPLPMAAGYPPASTTACHTDSAT